MTDRYIIITNELARSQNLEVYKNSISGTWSIVKVTSDYVTDLQMYTLEEIQPIIATAEWTPFNI
jgi:hypothetical protein